MAIDIDDKHWQIEDFKERIPIEKWRKILLDNDDKIIFRGRIVQLKAKNIGYGIVEICKEQKAA